MAIQPLQLWLLPLAALALAANVAMLVYLRLGLPQTKLVRTFLLMQVCIVVWNLFDLPGRYFELVDRAGQLKAATGIDRDWIAYGISGGQWLGIALLLPLTLITVLRFTRNDDWARSVPLRYALGCWALVVLLSGSLTFWFQDARWAFNIVGLSMILILVVDLVLLIRFTVAAPTATFFHQSLVVTFGFAVPIVVGVVNDIILTILGKNLPAFSIIATTATSGGLFFAIHRYRLFAVEATREEGSGRASKPLWTFVDGGVYLFDASRCAVRAEMAFASEVLAGAVGIGFVFTLPETLRKRTSLQTTPLLRFSAQPTKDELDPTNEGHLQMLPFIVEDVLGQTHGRAMVLLDDLQELATAAPEGALVPVLEQLQAAVASGKGVLILGATSTGRLPSEVAGWLEGHAMRPEDDGPARPTAQQAGPGPPKGKSRGRAKA